MSRRERFWPERKGCKGCNAPFGAIVILGQFCGYDCAGVPAPSEDSRDWPRPHWYPWTVGGTVIRRPKGSYNSQDHALRGVTGMVAYRCHYCYTWHRATDRRA